LIIFTFKMVSLLMIQPANIQIWENRTQPKLASASYHHLTFLFSFAPAFAMAFAARK